MAACHHDSGPSEASVGGSAGIDAGGGAPPSGSRAFAAPCAEGGECASGNCLRGRCSKACRAASDCPPGPEWVCALSPGRGTMCQCSPSGSEECDGRDNDCNGQIDDGALCTGVLVCESGQCTCPADHVCGAQCVDKSTDPAHCGACDNACPSGARCIAGVCQCPGGEALCGGRCVDLTSDCDNCGACGTKCNPGEVCALGHSSCAHVLCAGQCVDLDDDSHNCGKCGHDCSGGTCADAECQPTALVVGAQASGLAVNATGIYWMVPSSGEIRGADLDGQNVTTLATGQIFNSRFIVANSSSVYWRYSNGSVFGVHLAQTPCTSATLPGDCVIVCSGPDGGYGHVGCWANVSSIAADEAHVYWAAGPVLRTDLDGGNLATLAPDSFEFLSSLVVNDSAIFWSLSGQTTGLIGHVHLDGSGYGVLATGGDLAGIGGIAIDAANVYWASRGVVRRTGLTGGSLTALSEGAAAYVLTDGAWLYWSGSVESLNGIFKAPLLGGPPVLIAATTAAPPPPIVQDARFLYFPSGSDILRVAK